MTFGGGDFNSGNNEKTLTGNPSCAHQFFPEQIIDRVARIVISNGNATAVLSPVRWHIKSSGLDTPSPEKKVWVWRSILNGIARQR